MNVVFRPAELHDVDEIASLVNRAYRPSSNAAKGWTHESSLVTGARTSANQVRELFAEASTILLMSEGSHLLGCVHVCARGVDATIGMLATDPVYQARGLGKLLLAHAEQFAIHSHQVVNLKMFVLSSRVELIAFYERRGYMRTGQAHAYPLNSGVGEPLSAEISVLELLKNAANSDA